MRHKSAGSVCGVEGCTVSGGIGASRGSYSNPVGDGTIRSDRVFEICQIGRRTLCAKFTPNNAVFIRTGTKCKRGQVWIISHLLTWTQRSPLTVIPPTPTPPLPGHLLLQKCISLMTTTTSSRISRYTAYSLLTRTQSPTTLPSSSNQTTTGARRRATMPPTTHTHLTDSAAPRTTVREVHSFRSSMNRKSQTNLRRPSSSPQITGTASVHPRSP